MIQLPSKPSFPRLAVLLLWAVCLALPAGAAEKKKVTKLDDLPRHTYEWSGSAVELIESEEKFNTFAAKVRADIESMLAEYEIEDKTTLKGFKGTLLALELLEGDNGRAMELIGEIRELEDKPAQKLITGLSTESRIAAQAIVEKPEQNEEAFRGTFERLYTGSLQALPWEVVQAELKQLKGSMEIRSRNLYVGLIREQIDPAIQETGTMSRDIAETLINIRSFLEVSLPLKDEIVASLTTVIESHQVTKPDIWEERSVTLDPSADAEPVVVAIWDSGVDMPIFGERSFVNQKEQANNRDDDNNGFVDDIHGIAFDLEARRTPDMLLPLENAQERLPEMKDQIKGLLDLRAAIDSEEASALKQRMSRIQPEEVKPFIEDLNLFGNYAHGTHVAGIAAEGNPFIRILTARMTYDHRMIPMPPTIELAHQEARMYRDVVDYFKAANVRVVNMSWGGSLKDIEAALEANGVEKDAEKRAELARQIFNIGREGLKAAIESAPDILFVCAAGNSDNDVAFDEMIPSSFQLPNMLTVGAVDQAGDRTSFTSFGSNVEVYANGFEVDSYIPGGERMPFSGTSMASPNVVNLAAKLFALKPGLTVKEVIERIKQGTVAGGDEDFALIHPKQTVASLKQ